MGEEDWGAGHGQGAFLGVRPAMVGKHTQGDHNKTEEEKKAWVVCLCGNGFHGRDVDNKALVRMGRRSDEEEERAGACGGQGASFLGRTPRRQPRAHDAKVRAQPPQGKLVW